MNSDAETLVLDPSAMVDLLLGVPSTPVIREWLQDNELHAPSHFDAEVLSALGRLHRDGCLTDTEVSERLLLVQRAAIHHHDLGPLLMGAWHRRGNLRLTDALYVELAEQLDTPIIPIDIRIAGAVPRAETPTAW